MASVNPSHLGVDVRLNLSDQRRLDGAAYDDGEGVHAAVEEDGGLIARSDEQLMASKSTIPRAGGAAIRLAVYSGIY